MVYICGVWYTTGHRGRYQMQSWDGGWPWWGWGGAVRAEIYRYYLETPSFPLGPDTLCVF